MPVSPELGKKRVAKADIAIGETRDDEREESGYGSSDSGHQ